MEMSVATVARMGDQFADLTDGVMVFGDERGGV
jgi:hypothetical protein